MLIEIFSDVVCPWCFIGKRRLDRILESELGDGLSVVWRAYQLYPDLPARGIPRAQFMQARFGTDAAPADIYQRVLAEAEAEGLELDFERIETAPNTLDAHRLLSWAEPSGHQHELAEELFCSYFQEGWDIGDHRELVRAAQRAGLDGAAAAAMLAGEDELDKVRAELSLAQSAGVTGVPFFVLDGRFAIPGAQPAEVMEQLINRARERLAETGG